MKPKPRKSTYTIRLKPEILERLQKRAATERRTVANLVCYILIEWFEKR